MWPAQAATFIAVGELALFLALADRWPRRSRAGAVTLAGLGVSVAGNVGYAAGHSLTSRATAAMPPLAAAALAVGLGVLKRVVAATAQDAATAAATAQDGPPLPAAATSALETARIAYAASVRAATRCPAARLNASSA